MSGLAGPTRLFTDPRRGRKISIILPEPLESFNVTLRKSRPEALLVMTGPVGSRRSRLTCGGGAERRGQAYHDQSFIVTKLNGVFCLRARYWRVLGCRTEHHTRGVKGGAHHAFTGAMQTSTSTSRLGVTHLQQPLSKPPNQSRLPAASAVFVVPGNLSKSKATTAVVSAPAENQENLS